MGLISRVSSRTYSFRNEKSYNNMPVTPLETKADFDAAKNNSQLTVVDFWATWCGPCRMVAPKVAAMSEEFKDVAFHKVDVDENDEAAQDAGISAMPTFKLYKGGKEVAELVGANADKLKQLIEQHK